MTIQQAENKGKLIGFTLVTDEIEVYSVLNYLSKKRFAENRGIRGLFVGPTDHGDYSKVYGFSGIIPYNEKELHNIPIRK